MTTHEIVERFDQHRRKLGLRGFIADVVMLAVVLSLAVAVAAEPTILTPASDGNSAQAESPTPESNLAEIEQLRDQNARQARTILELEDRLDACTSGLAVACVRAEPYTDNSVVVPVRDSDSDTDGSDSDTTVVVEGDKPQPTPEPTPPPRVSSPLTDPVVNEIREQLDETLNMSDEVVDSPLLKDLPIDLGEPDD